MEHLKSEHYPLDVKEMEHQTETEQPKAYMVTSEKMPTITLETKQSGTIGTTPSVTVRPLREKIQDTFGAEENLHQKFIDPKAIEHSGGAFNK